MGKRQGGWGRGEVDGEEVRWMGRGKMDGEEARWMGKR